MTSRYNYAVVIWSKCPYWRHS